MTRRKMLMMTVLGLAALMGFAGHDAIFAADDKGQEALIKLMDAAKISLQKGWRPVKKPASRSRRNLRSKRASSNSRSIPQRKASFLRCSLIM